MRRDCGWLFGSILIGTDLITNFHLEVWQWVVLAIGAFSVGFSKTGIAGVGILGVATFALALPVRASVGVVLPVLIAADVVAVASYHHKASWPHLWRLFPWAITGILLGFWAMQHIDDQQTARILGGLLLFILSFQWWRQRNNLNFEEIDEALPHNIWFTAIMGIMAGFATMVGNAAGPIMILYLLAMRLPKMQHIGTGAWYYLILNTFKVPFNMNLGLINHASIIISAAMMPVAVAGAFLGRSIVKRIDEELFNRLAFISAFVASIHIAGIDTALYKFILQI